MGSMIIPTPGGLRCRPSSYEYGSPGACHLPIHDRFGMFVEARAATWWPNRLHVLDDASMRQFGVFATEFADGWATSSPFSFSTETMRSSSAGYCFHQSDSHKSMTSPRPRRERWPWRKVRPDRRACRAAWQARFFLAFLRALFLDSNSMRAVLRSHHRHRLIFH